MNLNPVEYNHNYISPNLIYHFIIYGYYDKKRKDKIRARKTSRQNN